VLCEGGQAQSSENTTPYILHLFRWQDIHPRRLGIDDQARTCCALLGIIGKRLMYRPIDIEA
jgi:hypothetical protein